MIDSPAYTLHKLVFTLDRVADQMLQVQFGISHKRALFLAVLQGQAPMSQHELAIALGCTDPAVSAMLIGLTKEGYVTIAPSPSHRRKRIVSLTPLGEERITQARQFLDGHFARLMNAAHVDAQHYNQLTEQIYQTLIKGKNYHEQQ